jgi:hypothetical protein
MGNLSITPTVPAGDGTALPSVVSSLGLEKTIHVVGAFGGALTVEASNGRGYVPVASFTAAGRKTLKIACQDMRVVRSASSTGTPVVTISGNDDGAQFAELAVGTPGASSDLRQFGTQNTIIVDIATGILTFTGQPADTETVTIGSKTYTFQTVLTDVDGNVLIGANTAASVANLIAAINSGAGAGTAYATSTTANTDVDANVGSTTSIMEAKLLDGAGTNTGIATTEAIANASWASATMGRFLDGVVQIQTSEDNATWTDLCGFSSTGHQTVEVTARYMRVNHVNNTLGSTPTVSVGAINDDTAHRPINTLASGTNVELDVGKGDKHILTLLGNVTIDNPINCEVGDVIELIVAQDGAGAHTVAWGTAWQWRGGTDPIISAGANAVDRLNGIVMTVSATGVATRILTDFGQAYAD